MSHDTTNPSAGPLEWDRRFTLPYRGGHYGRPLTRDEVAFLRDDYDYTVDEWNRLLLDDWQPEEIFLDFGWKEWRVLRPHGRGGGNHLLRLMRTREVWWKLVVPGRWSAWVEGGIPHERAYLPTNRRLRGWELPRPTTAIGKPAVND